MANRPIPPVGFRFNLNFFYSDTSTPFIQRDGPDACFQEVSGIGVEFETESVPDGANPAFIQQLPKKPNFPPLIFKRGLFIQSELFNWVNEGFTNNKVSFQPLDVEVNLVNESGETLFNARFAKAWPKKWSISDFNAMNSSIVIETFELVYQYFRIN